VTPTGLSIPTLRKIKDRRVHRSFLGVSINGRGWAKGKGEYDVCILYSYIEVEE
jgi:hypothetical protein